MQKPEDSFRYEAFTRWLRHALHNLYDFAELRRNPLVDLLAGDAAPSPAGLQANLVAAIEALRPAGGVNPQSNPARSYRVLYHRYVEQFSQAEVADDLGIGDRQLRRQEAVAVDALAGYLFDRFHLNLGNLILAGPPEIESSGPVLSRPEEERPGGAAPTAADSELEWLQQSFPPEPVQVIDLAQSALSTVEFLAGSLGNQLDWSVPANLPDVLVQVEPTRQALVIVLTEGLRAVPGGQVRVEVKTDQESQRIHLSVLGQPGPGQASPERAPERSAGLELARRLLEPSACMLEYLPAEHGPFNVLITLPVPERAAILFIDDNADTLQLFQRYLAGTPYIFLGARDQEQAFKLLAQSTPRVIITDVMMPGVDGWQLLGRLRNHPLVVGIPIIVGSILPQEQLAYSLGASAFLQKPIKRETLLKVLDEQMKNSPERGSNSAL